MRQKERSRKPLHSRTIIQGIVAAVALHVLVVLFLLCDSGHFSGIKEFISSAPASQARKKPGVPDHGQKKSGEAGRSMSTGDTPAIRSQELATQKVYCWIDDNGVRNFSNLPPPSHVKNFETRKMTSEDHSSHETKVIIKANQVIVPARVGFRGQEVVTYLLLDTGASTIVLNTKVAKQLNVRSVRPGFARLADGSSIRVYAVDLDYIVVGPKRIANLKANLVDQRGKAEPFDGLLGMNFLREVNYHVDFKRQVISWARFE